MRPEDWARLGAAMESEMPFPPPYQRIDVSGLAEPAVFDADVAYHGDWTEGLAPLDTVAQVQIRAHRLKRGPVGLGIGHAVDPAAARAHGVDSTLLLRDKLPHVWPTMIMLPEARESLRESAQFVARRTEPANSLRAAA